MNAEDGYITLQNIATGKLMQVTRKYIWNEAIWRIYVKPTPPAKG